MEPIYNYDPNNFEYLNEGVADISPLEPDVLLVPAHATFAKPPVVTKNESCVFSPDANQWIVKPDWRGVQLYKTADGAPMAVTQIGVMPVDVDATEIQMPSHLHSWDNGNWVLDQAKVANELIEAKAYALTCVSDYAKAKRMQVAGTNDEAEIAGWNNKLRIAQAIVAGVATEAEIAAFQAEVTARDISGETLEIFTLKVIKNSGFFAQAVGVIDGLKRQAQDSVVAAKSTDEVNAAIDAMKAKAEAAFEALTHAK